MQFYIFKCMPESVYTRCYNFDTHPMGIETIICVQCGAGDPLSELRLRVQMSTAYCQSHINAGQPDTELSTCGCMAAPETRP